MKRALRQFTAKRTPALPEPEVLSELRGLRATVPHLTGGLVATTDGLVVAHDTNGLEPEGLAALTAAALGVGSRLIEASGQGGFRELLTRGEHGYTATYAAGGYVVLTLFAGPDANVGRLHFEARRAGGRIAAIADAALERQDRS
ncbi:roadblock/LC7 domain-containing protein [Kitasatospora sp. DSM 101779]|uniref:roadblock/LC7 domain-containing protein n=1 Tax=Kitasatospora sp. DSM 101779 TaxID=2853165 RepID=UPI0021D96DB8|nr:roadblock/LC7 domain-containing protein [Kitasatospora sp. DSM 101779]MCU7821593.1 roadblock/LC7 domain-containing protein [Kitasatospora sp. DSM 101779]